MAPATKLLVVTVSDLGMLSKGDGRTITDGMMTANTMLEIERIVRQSILAGDQYAAIYGLVDDPKYMVHLTDDEAVEFWLGIPREGWPLTVLAVLESVIMVGQKSTITSSDEEEGEEVKSKIRNEVRLKREMASELERPRKAKRTKVKEEKVVRIVIGDTEVVEGEMKEAPIIISDTSGPFQQRCLSSSPITKTK